MADGDVKLCFGKYCISEELYFLYCS